MADEAAPADIPAAAPDAPAPIDGPVPVADASLLAGDPPPAARPDADKPEPTEEEKAAADAAKAEEDAKNAPPEKYEFTLPEGMEMDTAALEQFDPVARELGLNNEKAQKLVSMFAAVRQRDAEASAETVKAMRTGWVDTAKADKDYGGAKFAENLGIAKKALTEFGTPALTQALNETGLGDHPEIIRVFHKIGLRLAEDKFVSARSATAPPETLASRMPYKQNEGAA